MKYAVQVKSWNCLDKKHKECFGSGCYDGIHLFTCECVCHD